MAKTFTIVTASRCSEENFVKVKFLFYFNVIQIPLEKNLHLLDSYFHQMKIFNKEFDLFD